MAKFIRYIKLSAWTFGSLVVIGIFSLIIFETGQSMSIRNQEAFTIKFIEKANENGHFDPKVLDSHGFRLRSNRFSDAQSEYVYASTSYYHLNPLAIWKEQILITVLISTSDDKASFTYRYGDDPIWQSPLII